MKKAKKEIKYKIGVGLDNAPIVIIKGFMKEEIILDRQNLLSSIQNIKDGSHTYRTHHNRLNIYENALKFLDHIIAKSKNYRRSK